jgi:threonine/homoserine/homoserine lactone efflux protein
VQASTSLVVPIEIIGMTKNVILGSMGVCGLVALASLVDIFTSVPFGGFSVVMDVMFIVGAAIISYMGWETFREIS